MKKYLFEKFLSKLPFHTQNIKKLFEHVFWIGLKFSNNGVSVQNNWTITRWLYDKKLYIISQKAY